MIDLYVHEYRFMWQTAEVGSSGGGHDGKALPKTERGTGGEGPVPLFYVDNTAQYTLPMVTKTSPCWMGFMVPAEALLNPVP